MGVISGFLAVLLFVWIGCSVPHWAVGFVVFVGVIYLGVRIVADKR